MPADDLPSPGLGTAGNGEFEQCAESVRTALDIGYRHVDTARQYDNEAAVGEGLARSDVPREDVFVATKVWHDSLAYDDAVDSAYASLDDLGVDYVDLLYVHWPVGTYDPEETLAAFADLHDAGRTRHVGLSNFTPDLLDQARKTLDVPIFAHQVEMHPLRSQPELRTYAREHDHYLVAYSPLAKGAVLGVPELCAVARKNGTTPAQVTLAWLGAKENVVPVPKATGVDHLRENYSAADLELDDEDRERIERIERTDRVVDPEFSPW